MDLLFSFFPYAPLIGLMAALIVISRAKKHRSFPPRPPAGQPGLLAPHPQQSAHPLAPGEVRFHAELLPLRASLTARGERGVLAFQGRDLTFTPEGAAGPAWGLPCPSVMVRSRSMFSMPQGNVEIVGLTAGLIARVSREHINEFMENDLKRLREQTYGKEFVAEAIQRGARG